MSTEGRKLDAPNLKQYSTGSVTVSPSGDRHFTSDETVSPREDQHRSDTVTPREEPKSESDTLSFSDIYQYLPPLSSEEYDALKTDIKQRGVLVPVEYDEHGNILDGHHRVKACQELGVKEWPSVVRVGFSEDDKAEHVLKLNIARRQLSKEWKQNKAKDLRWQGWSYRRIAKVLGVVEGTIRYWFGDEGAQNYAPENDDASPITITGSDGKQYPATKPRTVAFDVPQMENDDKKHGYMSGFFSRNETEPKKQTAAQFIVSSNSNEWYTPAEYIESAKKVMGGIDIDPATCEYANQKVKAETYYTKETNGLEHDWPGRVWLNPPYGGLTGEFVSKLIDQHCRGITTEAILLVNSHATDTKWFQPLWDYVLCFTNHRINFIPPSGVNGIGSTHGSIFVYLGPKHQVFANIFKQFGTIVRKYSP